MRTCGYEKINTNSKSCIDQIDLEIKVDNGIVKEGAFSITYGWGYFSKKDGETHSLDLCEDCYDELIKSFNIPINIVDRNEIV